MFDLKRKKKKGRGVQRGQSHVTFSLKFSDLVLTLCDLAEVSVGSLKEHIC